MSEQFEKMTVLELRRTAKEMGVKLGAGISKQGIIDKLTEAMVNYYDDAVKSTHNALKKVKDADIEDIMKKLEA